MLTPVGDAREPPTLEMLGPGVAELRAEGAALERLLVMMCAGSRRGGESPKELRGVICELIELKEV